MRILNSIGSLLLVGTCGYIIGRIISIQIAYSSPPLQLIPDARPQVPVVTIDGIYNGMLEGTLSSGSRLFLGAKHVIPNESGAFTVPAGPLLTNEITVVVPEGMRYVASNRGKKYYEVTSAAASRLSPQNRVYFRTEKKAQEAGYVD